MFSLAATILDANPSAADRDDRIRVSKVLAESFGELSPIAHQTRAYANIRQVGQIFAVVDNKAALKHCAL